MARLREVRRSFPGGAIEHIDSSESLTEALSARDHHPAIARSAGSGAGAALREILLLDPLPAAEIVAVSREQDSVEELGHATIAAACDAQLALDERATDVVATAARHAGVLGARPFTGFPVESVHVAERSGVRPVATTVASDDVDKIAFDDGGGATAATIWRHARARGPRVGSRCVDVHLVVILLPWKASFPTGDDPYLSTGSYALHMMKLDILSRASAVRPRLCLRIINAGQSVLATPADQVNAAVEHDRTRLISADNLA